MSEDKKEGNESDTPTPSNHLVKLSDALKAHPLAVQYQPPESYDLLLPIFHEIVQEAEVLKRRIAHGDFVNFLEQNPDGWVMNAMSVLRIAATNLLDFDKFRMAFIRTCAIMMLCVVKGDRLFREFKKVEPLPGQNFKVDPSN